MKEKKQSFTRDEIHNFTKPLLEEMVLRLLDQVDSLNGQVSELTERINVLLSNQYGRKTEKSDQIDNQMEFCFNETEITIIDASEAQLKEPKISEINPNHTDDEETPAKKAHPKHSISDQLKALPEKEVTYTLSEEQKHCACGGSYRQIGKKTVTRLEFHPATFEVIKQVIYSYKCDSCGKIIRADHPLPLFEGSLATPSLIAGIITAKFVNALTYYRLEDSFAHNNALLTRQTMARWIIRTADVYFSLLYDRLKQDLLSRSIIHADETTVEITNDGRPAGAKSYMWAYTTEGNERPVVLFEYQKTRAHAHAKNFLKDYKGWLCCDGYEAYHSLGTGITVCGCWVHAKRHYANAVKALKNLPKRSSEMTVSEEAVRRIGDLFHTDKQWKDLPYEEHLRKRDTELRAKMEDYFNWAESKIGTVPPKTETGKGLAYSRNQKRYLLGCLTNPEVPLDNSEAERKIRRFVISRKNFVLIDTIAGAEASAIMFSMCETARANNLKPYEYFKYLLEEMPKHMKDSHRDMSFLEDLLPWSEALPPEIRKSESNNSAAS